MQTNQNTTHLSENLKRFRFIFTGFALCLFFSLPTAPEAMGQTCEKLVINGADGWYPFSFREPKTDEYQGIMVDVTRAVLDKMGIGLEAAGNKPWKRVVIDLEKGRIGALAGAYYTDERAQMFQYSAPFAPDEIRVFVAKGQEFPMKDISDLKGKNGLRPLGGSYGQEFDEYAKEHLDIREHKDSTSMLIMLTRQRADYVVLAYYDGLGQIEEAGMKDKIVPLETPITSNQVYLMFSKENPCIGIVDEFNQTLEAMRDSGELQTILERYQ